MATSPRQPDRIGNLAITEVNTGTRAVLRNLS